MIRPLTCISALLAFGSGLYLYQTKHHAQVVDRQIERTVQAITATRMQTRELAAAWTLLGNPDRLQLLADQYLDIKPVQPSQFVALADLDTRLPPPRVLPPPSAAPEDSGSGTTPIASASPTVPTDGADTAAPAAVAASAPAAAGPTPAARPRAVATATVQTAPTPAASPTAPVGIAQSGKAPGVLATGSSSPAPTTEAAKASAAAATHAADRKPADLPRPPHEVVQARLPPPRPTGSSPVIAELDRPATPVPQRLSPAPMTGSLLGMAHIAVPAPVPLPINTAPFSSKSN
jgi:hypothetical protein